MGRSKAAPQPVNEAAEHLVNLSKPCVPFNTLVGSYVSALGSSLPSGEPRFNFARLGTSGADVK